MFIDYSSEDTFEEEERGWQQRLTVHFFRPKSKQQVGVTVAAWTLISELKKRVGANDLVLYMDGDDLLMGSDILRTLNYHFLETKAWFVWGRRDGPHKQECRDLSEKMKGSQPNFRTSHGEGFRFCHPRMFKAFLLNYFEEKHFKKDFKADSKEWLPQMPDIVMVYRLLELSGPDRVSFYGNRELYMYRFNPLSLHVKWKAEIRKQNREHINLFLEKATPLPRTIHICACVFDRANTHSWLIHVLRHNFEDAKVFFHICVNDKSRMAELEAISGFLSDQFPNVTILWYPMETNVAGYGRFLVMKEVMKKMYVDYWITIDDDLMADPMEAYRARRPLSYMSGYGRVWERKVEWKKESVYNPRTYSSFKSTHVWSDPTMTFGPTRLSIVDSAILLDERLFQWEPEIIFGWEDLWLSYLVKSRGWWMGRFRPGTVKEFWELSNGGLWRALMKTKDAIFQQMLSCPFNILTGARKE